MLSRSVGRPLNPKNVLLFLFLICGRLRGFAGVCGLFAGVLRVIPGGENVSKNQFCNQSHAHIGVLVILGDFTKNKTIFRKSKLKTRTTRKFMENESPGGIKSLNRQRNTS